MAIATAMLVIAYLEATKRTSLFLGIDNFCRAMSGKPATRVQAPISRLIRISALTLGGSALLVGVLLHL